MPLWRRARNGIIYSALRFITLSILLGLRLAGIQRLDAQDVEEAEEHPLLLLCGWPGPLLGFVHVLGPVARGSRASVNPLKPRTAACAFITKFACEIVENHAQMGWTEVLLVPWMIYSLYFLFLCTAMGTCYGNLFGGFVKSLSVKIFYILSHFQNNLLTNYFSKVYLVIMKILDLLHNLMLL